MGLQGMASCQFLRRRVSIRFFFFLACVTLIVPIIWLCTPNEDETIVQEALTNVARDIRYADVYRKAEKQSKDLKYILLWTPRDYSPFYFLKDGQRAFLENNCDVVNCYVTDDKTLLGCRGITKFDAIAFNGRNMRYMRRSQLPPKRSPHQKYIFFNLESADNYPLCQNMFDGFFNWTATYRLDSDIPYPYLVVKDKNGSAVGPKYDMKWINDDAKVDNDLMKKLQSKNKAAAWFVSSCSDRNGRAEYARNLEKALEPYGLFIDIYGSCGTLQCPIDSKEDCNQMLEREYYFYLAFENSYAPDYVTEKLLTALQHNTVPIVYGSADYSRFLPPGSYLEAHKHTPKALAAEMARLMASPKLYSQFFKWKRHYDYYDATPVDDVCSLCAALNNDTMVRTESTYPKFREWWYPQYGERCWWMDNDDVPMNDLWP